MIKVLPYNLNQKNSGSFTVIRNFVSKTLIDDCEKWILSQEKWRIPCTTFFTPTTSTKFPPTPKMDISLRIKNGPQYYPAHYNKLTHQFLMVYEATDYFDSTPFMDVILWLKISANFINIPFYPVWYSYLGLHQDSIVHSGSSESDEHLGLEQIYSLKLLGPKWTRISSLHNSNDFIDILQQPGDWVEMKGMQRLAKHGVLRKQIPEKIAQRYSSTISFFKHVLNSKKEVKKDNNLLLLYFATLSIRIMKSKAVM